MQDNKWIEELKVGDDVFVALPYCKSLGKVISVARTQLRVKEENCLTHKVFNRATGYAMGYSSGQLEQADQMKISLYRAQIATQLLREREAMLEKNRIEEKRRMLRDNIRSRISVCVQEDRSGPAGRWELDLMQLTDDDVLRIAAFLNNF